jgi:hypothetical protein
MDQTAPTILPDELNSLLGAASAPVLLEHGMIVYDPLYSRCRSRPPAGAGGAT